jgi:hypothetical protein
MRLIRSALGLGGSSYPFLELVAPNGTHSFATGTGDGESCAKVEADVLGAGRYFLKVTPREDYPVVSYDLSVTLE